MSNLGSYLGVPLLHDRVTKSTLNFVVDKVRSKLHNWEARKFSFAGRITLAQSVLLVSQIILCSPCWFLKVFVMRLNRLLDSLFRVVQLGILKQL